ATAKKQGARRVPGFSTHCGTPFGSALRGGARAALGAAVADVDADMRRAAGGTRQVAAAALGTMHVGLGRGGGVVGGDIAHALAAAVTAAYRIARPGVAHRDAAQAAAAGLVVAAVVL